MNTPKSNQLGIEHLLGAKKPQTHQQIDVQEDPEPTPTGEDDAENKVDPPPNAEPVAPRMEVESNKGTDPPTRTPTPQQKQFVGGEASQLSASGPMAPHPEAKVTPPHASGADLPLILFDQVQCTGGFEPTIVGNPMMINLLKTH